MPVQIFDLDGALLAQAAAPTTRDAAMPSDADVLVLILQGRELPGFGPSSVPTLARLGRRPVVTRNGTGAPPTGTGEPGDREPDDGASVDDAPSGSALSTLDAIALFGEAARGLLSR